MEANVGLQTLWKTLEHLNKTKADSHHHHRCRCRHHHPIHCPQKSSGKPIDWLCFFMVCHRALFSAHFVILLTLQRSWPPVFSKPYADDVQANLHCLASNALTAVATMQRSMEALGSWMSSNCLLFNASKTQFLGVG